VSRSKDIQDELMALLREGSDLQLGKLDEEGLADLNMRYESWYTRALSAVSQIIPERAGDFQQAYKLDKRKEVTYETYTISDYLIGLVVTRGGQAVFSTEHAYSAKLVQQLAIVYSAAKAVPSLLRDVRTVLRAELLDDDLDAARALVRAQHLRSAGVVCGVVLEAHLKSVAARHGVKFRKTRLTIADLNDGLKGKAYDIPMWRFIQRLGDIRNLCGHSREREPKIDEVNDLISGTDKVIKEIF
jgi:hypothetical protein